jgi:hypothetical protein
MSSELTLGAAAKAVARGTTTVREWVKSGAVRARRNDVGHWLIERESLLAYASGEGSPEGPRRPRGAEAHPDRGQVPPSTEPMFSPTVEALVRSQEKEILHLKELLKEERDRCRRLEEERTQHLAEMRAILTKDASKEGVLSRWIRK